MASRLLEALDARIAKTRDPLENACLLGERAALRARQGELDKARADLAIVHARFDSRPHAVVSAWTSLAEGLIVYFTDFGAPARDKMQRALALANAVQAHRIRHLSAAWLAQVNYLEQDFETMVPHLELALSAVPPEESTSALARACLVTAQAYHWADGFDLAQPWYDRAHHYATDEGDRALVSAVMHNKAWLRLAEARRLAAGNAIDHRRVREVLMAAESTSHFDQIVGMASLHSVLPVLRGHVLALLDRHREALDLLEPNLSLALNDGLGRLDCCLHADIAWCRLQLGDAAGARQAADEARPLIAASVQTEERAAGHSRLAQVFAGLGDSALAAHHSALASADWDAYRVRQAQLLSLLAGANGIACGAPSA